MTDPEIKQCSAKPVVTIDDVKLANCPMCGSRCKCHIGEEQPQFADRFILLCADIERCPYQLFVYIHGQEDIDNLVAAHNKLCELVQKGRRCDDLIQQASEEAREELLSDISGRTLDFSSYISSRPDTTIAERDRIQHLRENKLPPDTLESSEGKETWKVLADSVTSLQSQITELREQLAELWEWMDEAEERK